MKRVEILGLLLGLALVCCPFARAQDTGQICVQTYDDRDQNGLRDANEPSIARGIGVHLLDTLDVTVASKLLDDSPYAATGLVCFDGLLAGDYQVVLTSSELVATTPSTFNAAVNPGSAPVRIDFGVKARFAERSSTPSASESALDMNTALGLVLGLIASFVTICVMSLLGLLIYLRVFRRPRNWARPQIGSSAAPTPATGNMPTVDATPQPPFTRDPNQGSPLIFSDDETDPTPAT